MPPDETERGPPAWDDGLEPTIVTRVKQRVAEGAALVSIAREFDLADFDGFREWVAARMPLERKYASLEAQLAIRRVVGGDVPDKLHAAMVAAADAITMHEAGAAQCALAVQTLYQTWASALAMLFGSTPQDGATGMTRQERVEHVQANVMDIYGFTPVAERLGLRTIGKTNGTPRETRCGLPLSVPDSGDPP